MMKLLARLLLTLAACCYSTSGNAQDAAKSPTENSPAENPPAPISQGTEEPQTTAAAESPTAIATRGQDVLIVVGSGGTDEYEKQFMEWGQRLFKAAERADVSVTQIGPQSPSAEPVATNSANGPADGNASAVASMEDRDLLLTSIAALSAHETTEPLWLVFLGHGTYDGRQAQLNLRGADVSDQQLSDALKNARRPIAVILCSSCSSPFINALSGPDRVIVSATKDGNQVQFARFGDAFTKAVDSLDADINRDGQTSLLEAWLFASRRTADFYKTEGRLATEHSLLDDNGDQRGTRAENFNGDRLRDGVRNAAELDGRLASRWTLIRSEDEKRLSPEQRAQRDELESKLEQLRGRRNSMNEDAYLTELETLLRPLAEIYEAADKADAVGSSPVDVLNNQ